MKGMYMEFSVRLRIEPTAAWVDIHEAPLGDELVKIIQKAVSGALLRGEDKAPQDASDARRYVDNKLAGVAFKEVSTKHEPTDRAAA